VLDNHVALVTWTIIEPGIYLLSACALSFKPLFRISAKAMHLHAFITHTKSTFQLGKSHATTSATTVATQTNLEPPPIPVGQFRRMSDDSDGSEKTLEVLATKMVYVNSELGSMNRTEVQVMTNSSNAV
jgi:hypothetical protein